MQTIQDGPMIPAKAGSNTCQGRCSETAMQSQETSPNTPRMDQRGGCKHRPVENYTPPPNHHLPLLYTTTHIIHLLLPTTTIYTNPLPPVSMVFKSCLILYTINHSYGASSCIRDVDDCLETPIYTGPG